LPWSKVDSHDGDIPDKKGGSLISSHNGGELT
jgi:hypothetical protein